MNLRERKIQKLIGQMGLDTFLKEVLKIQRLKPSSQNYLGLCPFHNDSHRSFGISIHYPHAWGCMSPHCQRGKELTTLVMKAQETSYERAQETIEKYMGYIKKVSEATLGIPYYEEEEEYELDKELLIEYSCGYTRHPYIKSRGLTDKVLIDFKVGYDRFRRRVVIPIYEDGKLINFVGRTVDKDVEPKYLIYEDVDRETFLFGEHMLPKKCPYIVLYEGILETVYSHQVGIPTALSLLGAYITKKQVERILRYTDTIVLFLDNDDAGKATTEKAIQLIKQAGGQVRVVRHLSVDKRVKKDLLDYKSPKIIKMMVNIALNNLSA